MVVGQMPNWFTQAADTSLGTTSTAAEHDYNSHCHSRHKLSPEASVNTDYTVFQPADIPNFDLGFELSSACDGNNSDVDIIL